MLAYVPIEASVLPGKVGDAANEVGCRHVDRNFVGQCGQRWVELGMPDAVGITINGTRGPVPILCTVGSGCPTILADSCCHDRSWCWGRRDLCKVLTIELRHSFGDWLPSRSACSDCAGLGCLWRYWGGIGEGGKEDEGDERQHGVRRWR